MPRPDAPPLTRGLVLRGLGCAVAVGLGAIAVWLIVTSTTQKRLELGVLAGLWGAMIGAFVIFGHRRPHPVAGEPALPDAAAGPSSALAVQLRTSAELDRAEDAAARRAFETRLENLLRREINTAVTREIASLRAEIADLRSELLDKVDGQLRLERIETTRVIGSDLEALQHEIRQLKFATQDPDDAPAAPRGRSGEPVPARPIVEPARVRPVSRQTAAAEDDAQPARVGDLEPPLPAPVPPPVAGPSDATMRIPPVPAEPEPEPVPPPAVQRPSPAPAPAFDEFASLPRIRPFTEFELDPIEPGPDADDEAAYAGRRRRSDESTPRSAGRHAFAADDPTGRRHATRGDGHDLLVELLARHGAGD